MSYSIGDPTNPRITDTRYDTGDDAIIAAELQSLDDGASSDIRRMV